MSSTKIFALGGLNEIGKNTYCFEEDNEIIIVDAGVKFPDEELVSVRLIIPDYQYLEKNQKKIKRLVITHGHEDHIGGIPFLLQKVQIPEIVGSVMSIAFIKSKLIDAKVALPKLTIVTSKSVVKTKNFTIDFYETNHSIPHAFGVRLKTKNGTIVSTGDYKFDFSPLYQKANLFKMAQIGNAGVDLLLSDSTNSLIPGSTPSEYFVRKQILQMFDSVKGRLIVSTFASNIDRIKIMIEAAKKNNRKIALIGRSMEKSIKIASELGYVSEKQSLFINKSDIKKTPAKNIVILCTGSQGEALAALTRIANGEHRDMTIIPGDTIIFSSSPIPGNFQSVKSLINKLVKIGANVLEKESTSLLHSSGHANSDDQKIMFNLMKPKYFMPMHGDYRMMIAHVQTAISTGLNKNNGFVVSNGDVLEMKKGIVTKTNQTIECSPQYIVFDSNFMNGTTIKERLSMGKNGAACFLFFYDTVHKAISGTPIVQMVGNYSFEKNEKKIMQVLDTIKNELNQLLKTEKKITAVKQKAKWIIQKYMKLVDKQLPEIVVTFVEKN